MNTTKRKVTAAVRKKIERLLRLQDQFKDLAYEIQDDLGLADVTDNQGWTLQMNLDQSGMVHPLESTIAFCERFPVEDSP